MGKETEEAVGTKHPGLCYAARCASLWTAAESGGAVHRDVQKYEEKESASRIQGWFFQTFSGGGKFALFPACGMRASVGLLVSK